MNAIITTVLPVFGLILLGYGFAKARVIDEQAGRGITLFVFNIAIPAFLFRTVASMGAQEGAPWALWFCYFGGLFVAWAMAALVSRYITSLTPSGGAAASMATGFGNLALLGTPLAFAHFGEGIALPMGMILSVHAPILWFVATLHRELARHSGQFSWARTASDLFRQLSTNAIILSLVAGGLWRFTGLGLNVVPDKMLAMLAEAGVPTALFALGVSLSSYSLKGSWSGMTTLICLKMVLMPLLVYGLTRVAGTLPPLYVKVAVLFAAMPTGANAFLFAQKHDEAVPAVSGAIALGTGLAAITASILLWLMDAGYV